MDLAKKVKEFINIFDFVSKKKKFYFIILQIFSILSSFLDTISVGAIVPFIAIASDPNKMMKNDNVKYVMELLKINGSKQLIVFITIFFVGLIFFVAIFKWINNYLNLRLTNQIASQLAFKLFNKSLYQPYILHTQRNSSQILFIVSRATEVLNLLINPIVLFINSIIYP